MQKLQIDILILLRLAKLGITVLFIVLLLLQMERSTGDKLLESIFLEHLQSMIVRQGQLLTEEHFADQLLDGTVSWRLKNDCGLSI